MSFICEFKILQTNCAVSEEFTAHNANVNCLALGHKSGHVLVTGGDDKKVNLWAIGKTNCIMVSNCYVNELFQSIYMTEEVF